MIIADLIALLLVAGLLGLGGKSLVAVFEGAERKRQRTEKETEQMQQDLRDALLSHDYRKLDDFMVLWGGKLDKAVIEHVRIRRDELYIENDEANTGAKRTGT